MKKLILPTLFLTLLMCSLLQVNLVAKQPGETATSHVSEAVSDSEDAEVTIHGRVFMPDGSPAKNRNVDWEYMNPTKNSSILSGTFTNDQGEYSTCPMPIGARMLALVKNAEGSSEWLEDGLASPILSGFVKENPAEGEYDIHLREGVRVGGTLRYEDGTPAVNKTVVIYVYGFGGESITLPERDELGRDNFFRPYLNQHVYSDENGNYAFWLLPDGVYEIEQEDLFGDSRQQPLELAADEKERTINFTLPQPTTLHFTLPDGTPVPDAEVYICSRMAEHQNRNIMKLQPLPDGSFQAVLSPVANLISVRTPDGKFGANQLIKDDERLKPVTITLQPAATARVRLVNEATDQPIVGKKLAYYPHLQIHSMLLLGNYEMLEEVQTDENGIATLSKIYLGVADYNLYDGYSGDWDKIRITVVPPRNPGETVDLGDHRVKEKTKEAAKQEPDTVEIDPETTRLVRLAESMVTLPDMTVERLRDVADDLAQSEGMKTTDAAAREPVNRALVKVYDKIIALKPAADVLGDVYWSKNYLLHDLIRVRYADEDIAALEKFADEMDNTGNSRIAGARRDAKSWAKRSKVWQLERREHPTLEQFLAVREETLGFIKDNPDDADSYCAWDVVSLAEKLWTKDLLTRDQMLETYRTAIDALESHERNEFKSELEARLAFHRLEGKTLDITGTDMNGKPFDWNSYKGKTVLMAFTSSWYGGREMQDVIRFHEEFDGKGLETVTFVSLTEGHRSSTTEQDKTWLAMMVDRLEYPGEVLTEIHSPEVALQKISEFLGIRQYTFLGATFLLIGEDGKVISLADVDQTRKSLVRRFGEPNRETRDRADKKAQNYVTVPKPCESNLREIMLAMHNYHDVYKTFPPAYTVDEKGNKLHSWRVLLLPWLGQKALYDQIRLDEPWDSEHNRKISETIVPVFQCHETAFAAERKPVTNYAVVVGPQAAFEENGKAVWIGDLHDGTSNTLGVLERATPVNWMEPVDITFDEAVKGIGVSKNGIAGVHNGGCNCASCDGATHFLPKDLDLKVLRAILTRAGGESVSLPQE